MWFIASLLYHVNAPPSRDPQLQDVLAIALYQLCVSVCFILSTFYHTFSDHSPGLHKFGNELDHLGIVLVMWGTGMSGTHFAFYCHQALRNVYFAFLTLTGLGCAVYTLRPKFRRPEYRTARFLMYCFLGTSLFAPVVHGLVRFGAGRLQAMMGLSSFFALALINFSGAAVYAARIPERWYPGAFDLLGQSHNWMHVLVLAGALVRLRGLYDTMGRWQVSTERYGLCQEFI
jgi:adiponectin receptor